MQYSVVATHKIYHHNYCDFCRKTTNETENRQIIKYTLQTNIPNVRFNMYACSDACLNLWMLKRVYDKN